MFMFCKELYTSDISKPNNQVATQNITAFDLCSSQNKEKIDFSGAGYPIILYRPERNVIQNIGNKSNNLKYKNLTHQNMFQEKNT